MSEKPNHSQLVAKKRIFLKFPPSGFRTRTYQTTNEHRFRSEGVAIPESGNRLAVCMWRMNVIDKFVISQVAWQTKQ